MQFESIEIKRLYADDVEKYKSQIEKFIFESNRHAAYTDSYRIQDAKNKLAELKEYLLDESAIVFGALEYGIKEVSENLVGFIWAYEYPFRDDKNRIYVSILHVGKKYRSKGIGSKLLSSVEQYAKEKGYGSVFLHTEGFNDGAIRFYHSKGYDTERIQLMKICVGGGTKQRNIEHDTLSHKRT